MEYTVSIYIWVYSAVPVGVTGWLLLPCDGGVLNGRVDGWTLSVVGVTSSCIVGVTSICVVGVTSSCIVGVTSVCKA